MVHADFLFSQRRKGRKEFLRNAGHGGLGGLARDINDPRTRIYFLAKVQSKRLGITVFQPRLKVCTFARTNYYEYGKQRQVQESP